MPKSFQEDATSILGSTVSGATAALFYGLSRIRGDRFFHPDGRAYRATYRLGDPPAGWGVPAARRRGGAIVRLSRGASVTRLLPDVLGLAIRLNNINGRGRHQDFLLVTSAPGAVVRHALLPSRSYSGDMYSCILPYECGGETVMIGARTSGPRVPQPETGEGLSVRLLASGLGGSWRTIGLVELGDRMSEEESTALRFTPWNSGGGIRPSGPINELRRRVYRASQSAREDARS